MQEWSKIRHLMVLASNSDEFKEAENKLKEALTSIAHSHDGYFENGNFYEAWGNLLWKEGNRLEARNKWNKGIDHFETAGTCATGSGEGISATHAMKRLRDLVQKGPL